MSYLFERLVTVAVALYPCIALAQIPPSRPCPPVVSAACSAGVDQPLEWAGEERLCVLATDSTEIYRFTWVRAFHNPVVVRIEQRGDTWTLSPKELLLAEGGSSHLIVSQEVLINPVQWRRLASLVDSTGLWSRLTDRDRRHLIPGNDGASWILESVRDGQYRSMDCDGAYDYRKKEMNAIGRFGIYVLTLVGLLPADPREIY